MEQLLALKFSMGTPAAQPGLTHGLSGGGGKWDGTRGLLNMTAAQRRVASSVRQPRSGLRRLLDASGNWWRRQRTGNTSVWQIVAQEPHEADFRAGRASRAVGSNRALPQTTVVALKTFPFDRGFYDTQETGWI